MDRSEEREQARFVRWCSIPPVRDVAPALVWLFHVPNGGKRDAFVGAQMVALGVKRGVPDLLLPVARNRCHGLAIEFKSATGTTTEDQDRWLGHLQEECWWCDIARSAEEAREIVSHYLDCPELLAIPLP